MSSWSMTVLSFGIAVSVEAKLLLELALEVLDE